jgi:hypothetical protein
MAFHGKHVTVYDAIPAGLEKGTAFHREYAEHFSRARGARPAGPRRERSREHRSHLDDRAADRHGPVRHDGSHGLGVVYHVAQGIGDDYRLD